MKNRLGGHSPSLKFFAPGIRFAVQRTLIPAALVVIPIPTLLVSRAAAWTGSPSTSAARAPGVSNAGGAWSAGLSVGYAQGLSEGFASSGSVALVADGSYTRGWWAFGLEAGYHSLGTETTTVKDAYGPGTSVREEDGHSVVQATLAFRIQRPTGTLRPYGAVGSGVYFVLHRYDYEQRDANGVPIDRLRYSETFIETKPGLFLGAGLVKHRAFGRFSVGLHGRWQGMLFVSAAGGEFPSFFTISAGITLD